jgi:sugar lactone lactonase YvrE
LLILPICAWGQVITTIAGNGMPYTSGSGWALNTGIGNTGFVTCDKHGNYYFCNTNNVVCKVSFLGTLSTIAGTGTMGYNGDSISAIAAQLNSPLSIAIDSLDNIYVSDENNNRVRKINSLTGIITTIAGNGLPGFSGDSGLATSAKLNAPYGICLGNNNDLYIADHLNNRIRRVNLSTGIITTVAGTGTLGYYGDNMLAVNAEIYSPLGICTDNSNNIYICNGVKVRKIDNISGIITTVAGNGIGGFSGDNGLADTAEMWPPVAVTVDSAYNIYIADMANNRIRKVDGGNHIITTVAGNGGGGFSGDNNPAVTSEIHSPRGVALDACGNLLINDNGNKRIRKVWFNTDTLSQVNISVTPNDTVITGTQVTTTATATNYGTITSYQWVKNGANASTSITFTYTPTNGDSVYCIVTVRACTGRMYNDTTTAIHLTVTGDAGVANTTNSTIHTYPNPVTDVLHVATTEPKHYVLHNLMGITLLQGSVDKQNAIDMKAIPSGIYLLQLTNQEGQREVVRVVKE